MLISSHVLAEVAKVVDHVVVVTGGRLRAQGPLADLTAARSLEDVFLDLTAEEGAR